MLNNRRWQKPRVNGVPLQSWGIQHGPTQSAKAPPASHVSERDRSWAERRTAGTTVNPHTIYEANCGIPIGLREQEQQNRAMVLASRSGRTHRSESYGCTPELRRRKQFPLAGSWTTSGVMSVKGWQGGESWHNRALVPGRSSGTCAIGFSEPELKVTGTVSIFAGQPGAGIVHWASERRVISEMPH